MPGPFCYEYPRPAVTVDLVAFGLDGDRLRVLLVRRKGEPFAGSWALPGGFLDLDEPAEAGARREFREETGAELAGPLASIGFFDAPGRDPRGRTISLAFAAAARPGDLAIAAGDDAAEAAWRPASGTEAGPLAFDHDAILARGRDWLRSGVRRGDLGLALLPGVFDAAGVRSLFRAAVGPIAGAPAWLRRMERAGQVEAVEGSGRLYRAVQ